MTVLILFLKIGDVLINNQIMLKFIIEMGKAIRSLQDLLYKEQILALFNSKYIIYILFFTFYFSAV